MTCGSAMRGLYLVAHRLRVNGSPALAEPRAIDAIIVSPATESVHRALLAEGPSPQTSSSFHPKLPDCSARAILQRPSKWYRASLPKTYSPGWRCPSASGRLQPCASSVHPPRYGAEGAAEVEVDQVRLAAKIEHVVKMNRLPIIAAQRSRTSASIDRGIRHRRLRMKAAAPCRRSRSPAARAEWERECVGRRYAPGYSEAIAPYQRDPGDCQPRQPKTYAVSKQITMKRPHRS